jgi:YegS/Rv2252/BmrU family lipid kinase
MTTPKALFIVNPAAGAGRGLARWEQFKSGLERDGFPSEHVFTNRAGEAMQIARERTGEYEVLLAVGGDGTAFEVASGILSAGNTKSALGVVPTGTGNDIGDALGVGNLSEAHQAFVGRRMQAIDVIRVECQVERQAAVRHALLFAGVGIASESLRRTTPAIKRLFGERLAYPVGLFRALWSYAAPLLRVTHDQQVDEKRFLFVCASNSECAGGGMKLAPGARMDDGRLNINLIEALGRWEAVKQLRRVCQGRHTDHPKVRYLMASELTVEGDTALEVAADGELIGYTPARFVVLPKALRVMVNW